MKYLVLLAAIGCTGPLSAPELVAAWERAHCRLPGDTVGPVVFTNKAGVITDCGWMVEREKECFETARVRPSWQPCVVGEAFKR